MVNKKQLRLDRAARTRKKIAELRVTRLCVFRSGNHIYAQIIDADGAKVLASASTLEAETRNSVPKSKCASVEAATIVGKQIAEKAKQAGIDSVAFDRSGYKYHGRVKALAQAAREHGLKF
jgi:large subunit ribosomal protein L18